MLEILANKTFLRLCLGIKNWDTKAGQSIFCHSSESSSNNVFLIKSDKLWSSKYLTLVCLSLPPFSAYSFPFQIFCTVVVIFLFPQTSMDSVPDISSRRCCLGRKNAPVLLSLSFCSSSIWNYWIRNIGGCDPTCSFTTCIWFCCLWVSEIVLVLNLLVIFPMGSLNKPKSLFSLAVAIPFFCVLRSELLWLRYRRGMRDPSRGSKACTVEMRIDRVTGNRLKGTASCGKRVWGVVSIPGRKERRGRYFLVNL